MSISVSKRGLEALSRYMLREFASSYSFLAMAATFRDMGLYNCTSWCIKKSEVNRKRALDAFNHLVNRGARFKLAPIPVSRQDWRAPLHIFEEVSRQEQEISNLVTAIYESAVAEKDYMMQNFVAGLFQKHQESELEASRLLNKLRIMQSSEIGVFEFDRELADIPNNA